ncbi:MAG: pentapeptide repeat-containing protein, partial [Cellulosilyticaceae bacterium]
MIAANLEKCCLKRANFLGADMRDTNMKDTDLSESLFLTQMQINSAKGNAETKLPSYLSRPSTWC